MKWARWAVAGLALALLVGVPAFLTESALHLDPARRVQPDRPRAEAIAREAGATLEAAEVRGADGARLRGWTFIPALEKDNGKAVLLLHGVGDSRRGMLGFARYFATRGFTTIAADSRSHGISEGAQITYGLRERDDVSRWADYALSMRAGAKLYGLGMSMGAAVLLQSLPKESRFRSVVAECSYSTFRDAAAERVPRMTGLPAALAPLVLVPAFTYAQLRYGLDFEAISPLDAIKQTSTPVLLIHGLADDRTAPEQSRKLAAAAPKGVAELWEVPGARHVRASEVAQKEFEDRVMRWFEK